jgi:6-phosphogluconolactonase/glucosamine-6-phosphate isomerase/deaminase
MYMPNNIVNGSNPVFKRTISSDQVAEYLAATINDHLNNNEKTLWLVAGGSSIYVAAEASKMLAKSKLGNLSVSLTDERYGPVGHKDSNWQQLLEVGFVLPNARLLPVLNDGDLNDTALSYAGMLAMELKSCNFSIGLFGIGEDGHTAGILPSSPAVSTRALAIGYDGGMFQRITMAPAAIVKLDEAVVYAFGKPKWPILDKLEADIPIEVMPAQVLKTVQKLSVFNDYKGVSE